MALKILATADLHLGMKFSGYPVVQSELTEARFKALKGLVEKANQEGCNLFIIAGDLFDRVKVAKQDIVRTAAILENFQGELLAVLPGNHDFHVGSAGTLWQSFREKAGDRVIVLDKQQVYDLNHYGLKVKLYAGPCDSKHSKENAVSRFSPSQRDDKNTLHIGVAHGSMAGMSPDAQGNYFPMKQAELEKLGLDFWIVGHTHYQYPTPDSADAFLFIPGSPEPDGFDCRHEGKAWIIDVQEDNQITKISVSTGTYRFHQEEVNLGKNPDLEMLFAKFLSADFEKTLVRLTLTGRLSKESMLALQEITRNLEHSLFWIRIDDSQVIEEITSDTVEAEFTQGSFPYLLLKKLIEEQDYDALQAAYDLIQEAKS